MSGHDIVTVNVVISLSSLTQFNAFSVNLNVSGSLVEWLDQWSNQCPEY